MSRASRWLAASDGPGLPRRGAPRRGDGQHPRPDRPRTGAEASAAATTIVIGNPMIADVAVQKNGSMVVTGKSYGTTNLIAQDSTGAVIGESLIRVEAATDGVVLLQRGLERESYSCTPRCQPTLSLGDVQRHFEAVGRAGERAQRPREIADRRSSAVASRWQSLSRPAVKHIRVNAAEISVTVREMGDALRENSGYERLFKLSLFCS